MSKPPWILTEDFPRLEFKPEDFWIGAFWKVTKPPVQPDAKGRIDILDIWICLLPMVPLHLQWFRVVRF